MYEKFVEDDEFWWGQLKTLKIHNIKQITKTDQLYNILKTILWSLEQLEYFSINNCEITEDLSNIVKLIPKSIKKLDLRAIFIHGFIEPIRFILPNLENLKITSSAMSKPLYQFKCPKLKKLDGSLYQSNFSEFLKKQSATTKKLEKIVLPLNTTSIILYIGLIQSTKSITLPVPKKKSDIGLILKSFDNLQALKIKNLTDNKGNLTLDVFKQRNSLKVLSIQNCKIYRLLEAIPDHYPELKTLKIYDCEFIIGSKLISFLLIIIKIQYFLIYLLGVNFSLAKLKYLRELELTLTAKTDLAVICEAVSCVPLHFLYLRQDQIKFGEASLLELCNPPLIFSLEHLILILKPDLAILQQIIVKFKKLRKFTSPIPIPANEDFPSHIQYILTPEIPIY